MTPTSARLWTRAPKAGPVMLGRAPAPGRRQPVRAVRASRGAPTSPFSVRSSGLRPGRAYRYRFAQGGATSADRAASTTAPAPTSTGAVRFAISGDADATPGPDGKPGFNGFETYGAMARGPERLRYQLRRHDLLGLRGRRRARGADRPAEVGEVPARPRARAAAAPAGLDRRLQRLGRPRVRQRLLPRRARRRDLPRGREGVPRLHARVVHTRAPATTGASAGASTSSSSSSTVAASAARRRRRRAAATSRRPRRRRCARRSPRSLRRSRSRCRSRASTRSPRPSGRCSARAQLAAFTRAIRASTATFKVVVNPEPMLQLYALPYDRWEGYAAERARVLDVLQSVRNVVVLTTDMHAHVIGEIRTDDVRAGRPARDGHLGGRHRPGGDEHVREGDRLVPRLRPDSARS